VRRIELGAAVTVATLGLYCAALPICQLLIYATVLVAALFIYYDYGNGVWVNLAEWRFAFNYWWGYWDSSWYYYYAWLSPA